jgi:rsbT co-antagonist protein RsbR
MTDQGVIVPPARIDMQSDLRASIDTILAVLAEAGSGNLSRRLDLPFPETHPVGALASSVNSMLDSLTEAQTESAANLQELGERIETIERQREAIRNLSVPIIEIWNGVLCAPVVGVLDSMRAADVTTSLLTAVVQKKARHAIIDVTGIEVMDTQSCDHFLRMARAVGLLGARCALSGVHPNIARTIVHMGVELHGLKSYRTMRDALRYCVMDARAKRKK